MKIDWIEVDKLAASGIPLGVEDLESLHRQGIRAILSLTEHPLTSQKGLTSDLFNRLDIRCKHLPVPDRFPPKPAQAWEAVRFIDQMIEQGRPVLIHCHAGIGRTGTILHAYYLAHGLSLEQAAAKIKSTRPASQFFILTDLQKAFLRTWPIRDANRQN